MNGVAKVNAKPLATNPADASHQRATVKLEMNFFTLDRYGATSARAQAAR